MPTTSTNAGRAQLAHPDLGHDGGSGLWNKIHALFAKLSDSMAIQWFGNTTLSDTGSIDFVHNFDMNLVDLEVHILESDVVLTQEQQSVYGIVEKSGNLKNAITVTNNSGGSKTFDIYILGFNLDKMLGRYKAQLTTTSATQATLGTIAIPTDKALFLDVKVSARKDGTNANIYELKVMCENNGGTVTVTEMEKTSLEDVSSYDVTVVGSGANALVKVTGEATSVAWSMVAQKTYF